MPLTETGSDQLAAGLGQIAGELDEVTPDAAIVVARARKLAPVATGRLAGSIRGTGDGDTATIGTTVRYGLPVHFGVPSRGQRARPFLFQAVDAETARIVQEYAKDVQALIDKRV